MSYKLYRLVFPNGKSYFGITNKTTEGRWKAHQRRARRSMKDTPIQNAIRKFNPDTIIAETLVIGEEDYIKNLEVTAIEHFKTTNRKFGYNVHLGGTISPMQSQEVADKVNQSKLDWTPEFKEQFSKRMSKISSNWWESMSEEERENFCLKLKSGQKQYWDNLTDEEKQQRKDVLKISLEKGQGWNRGLSRPEWSESAKKAAEKRGPEWLANVQASRQDPDVRKRISEKLIGHPYYGPTKRPDTTARFTNTIWITDGIRGRRVSKDHILTEGWYYGKPHRLKTK